MSIHSPSHLGSAKEDLLIVKYEENKSAIHMPICKMSGSYRLKIYFYNFSFFNKRTTKQKYLQKQSSICTSREGIAKQAQMTSNHGNQTLNIPQHRLLGEQVDQFGQHHWHSTPSQIMAPQWTSNCYHNIKANC